MQPAQPIALLLALVRLLIPLVPDLFISLNAVSHSAMKPF